MLYIFDFDYTLVNSSAGIVKAFIAGFEKTGKSAPADADILKTIGSPLEHAFISFGGKQSEYETFFKAFREESDKTMIASTRIIGDTQTVLKSIKKDPENRVAVFSAKDGRTIKEIAKRFDFGGYLDMVEGFDDIKKGKPDREGIDLILRHFSMEPQGCVYIGDSLIDFRTAQDANVKFIAVLTGVTKKEEFEDEGCRNIVDSLTEAVELSKKI